MHRLLTLATASCFILMIFTLSSPVTCSFPGAFDVVTLAYKPSCVNRQMITKVNKYLLPKPRKIHVVSGRSCDVFVKFADNVVCYQEDSLIPGLTYKVFNGWLAARFGGKARSPEVTNYVLRQRGRWFWQQIQKLAAAAHVPDLSDHFLILDSDMIVLRPLTWFMPPEGEEPTLNFRLEPSPFPPARPVESRSPRRSCTNPHPFRTLIHIGGWAPPYSYHRTYRYLTGKELIDAHTNASLVPGYTGRSLVTHHILVYKPYMREFLGNITKPRYRGVPTGWALSIADALTVLKRTNELREGFSEYWSYLSWVQEHYPCTVMQAEKRAWTRIPLAYPGAMSKEGFAGAVPYKNTMVPVCCPTSEVLQRIASKGYYYTGYELGHFSNCNFHHEAFKDGYAEWFVAP